MTLYDNTDIDKLDSYLNGSSFCFFATVMIGEAEGYDYAFHLRCDTEQQFNLQLDLILNTFRNLIECCQVYRLLIRKEVPRLLHSTHDLEGIDILNSINKEASYELEYMQSLFRYYFWMMLSENLMLTPNLGYRMMLSRSTSDIVVKGILHFKTDVSGFQHFYFGNAVAIPALLFWKCGCNYGYQHFSLLINYH